MIALEPRVIRAVLDRAFAEDLGEVGDITTAACVPESATLDARLVLRQPGRVAGLAVAEAAFHLRDPGLAVSRRVAEGADVAAGTDLMTISGPARAILTAERPALNLLARMSGIATATRDVVARAGRPCIAATRKTTPGLRALEKYAVRVGGGHTHRFGLNDGVLIKDNHIAAAGGVAPAVAAARAAVGHMMVVAVEVDTFDQLDQALAAGVDSVLLDNMTPAQIALAVRRVAGRATTEASGGITPATVADYAATGVDVISLGWLTQNAPTLDIGLDVN